MIAGVRFYVGLRRMGGWLVEFDIIAQVISILAMIFNILSYQGKDKRAVILMQMAGAFFFCISYFMLGAVIGGILNILAMLRSLVFIFERQFRAESRVWLIFFGAAYLVSYILTFTVFGKAATLPNLLTEALPVFAMLVITISYTLKDARSIRRLALLASPLWLAYNIISLSLGGILCEAISLVSIILAMVRLDKKDK